MKSSTNGTCSAEHSEYLRRLKRKKRFISFMQLAILIGFIAVWEILGRLEIINTFIFSSPSRIASTISRLYGNGELLMHIGVTTFETVAGFIIGTLLGTLIAVLRFPVMKAS